MTVKYKQEGLTVGISTRKGTLFTLEKAGGRVTLTEKDWEQLVIFVEARKKWLKGDHEANPIGWQRQ